MKSFFARFFKDESGPSTIEYGLIASLISVVSIGAMTLIGQSLLATFNSIAAAF
jgi:pilus assembly protein Flp/PilA